MKAIILKIINWFDTSPRLTSPEVSKLLADGKGQLLMDAVMKELDDPHSQTAEASDGELTVRVERIGTYNDKAA